MPNVVEIIVRAVDKTKSGLTSPIKNIEDLKKSVENLTPAFAFLATAAATAFAVMAKQAITSAAEMQKMGQVTALGAEYFSTFAYAAEKAGLNLDKTYDALRQWNINLPAAIDKTSELGKMYVALGVQVTDTSGRVRDQKTLLMEIADQFSKTADSAEKTRIAGRLFGETGTSLIPILNKGSAAIKEMQEEARDFGQEVSQNTANSAVEFQANLARLQAQVGGVVKSFVAELLPTFVSLSASLIKAAKDSDFFAHAALYIVNVFKALVVGTRFVYAGFQVLGKIIGVVASMLMDWDQAIKTPFVAAQMAMLGSVLALAKGLAALGEIAGRVGEILYQFFTRDWAGAWKSSTDAVADAKAAIVDAGTGVLDAWKNSGSAASAAMTQNFQNIKEAAKTLGNDIKVEIDKAVDFGVDIWGPMKMPALEGGDSKPQQSLVDNEKIRRESDAARALYLDMITSMKTGVDELIAKEEEHYQKRLADIANLQLTETERREYELTAEQEHAQNLENIQMDHNEQIQSLENELTKGLKSEYEQRDMEGKLLYEEQLKRIAKLKLSEEDSIRLTSLAYKNYIDGKSKLDKRALAATSDFLGQAAALAQNFGKAGFYAAKALAVSQGLINTYLAGTRALAEGGPIAGPPLKAAMIALGLANVAMIAAQSPSGQAHSGIDYVPSEGTWMLDRGERVIQPEANEQLTSFLDSQNGGGGGGRGMMSVEIHLDGDILARAIGKMGADGRLVLPASAIV